MYIYRNTAIARHTRTLQQTPDYVVGCRSYLFETRKDGKPRTTGVVLQRRRASITDLPSKELATYTQATLARSDAAARGKLAIHGGGELCVLQASPHGDLTPAYCGNATAAVALVQTCASGELKLAAPGGGQVTVKYRCTGSLVTQSWLIPSMTVKGFTWRNRRCFRVRGLNAYTVVTGGLPVGVSAETCRTQLAAGHPNAKLAVLGEGAERNHVAFFNASGRHGAAPMTGLASLAVAAHASPEFAARLGGRAVTYQTATGIEDYILPGIGVTEDGRLQIALPDVEAFISPLNEVSQ